MQAIDSGTIINKGSEKLVFTQKRFLGGLKLNRGIKAVSMLNAVKTLEKIKGPLVSVVFLIDDSFLRKNHLSLWQIIEKFTNLNTRFVVISDVDILNELNLDYIRNNLLLTLPETATPNQLNTAVNAAMTMLELETSNLLLQSQLTLNREDLKRITVVGQSLATEFVFDRLIELILKQARELASADGGSIYLVEKPESGKRPTHIRFMKSALQLEANEFLLPINKKSIAGYVALTSKVLQIENVQELGETEEFTYNSEFDKAHNYYTKSMMVIPMKNHNDEVIGILQLINRKKNFHKKLTREEMMGDEVISFNDKDLDLVKALAGQAAVAIGNQRLIEEQRDLLESFIKLIADAIDSKSPYTGAHCQRVPVITEMLARAACDTNSGPFKDFNLNQEEWYELNIAAWLHDCGKITTPVHVMDKATKLETIYDRIELVRDRFEILKRDAEIAYLKKALSKYANEDDQELLNLKREYEQQKKELEEQLKFIETANIGGEFLEDAKIEQIKSIANYSYSSDNQQAPVLDEEMVRNLSIRKGTLTEEERVIINSHMVETIRMLEGLPFPGHLNRIPEYAGGHHEKMDGTGYPKGIYAADMSIPARIMVIADVFEALTAIDRPYKKGKKLSETMRIMGYMKKENHLDPDLFNLFVTSKVYLKYAQQYLSQDLIDEVDEQALLAIEPDSYDLPDKEIRQQRHVGFLPEYEEKAMRAKVKL